ncbi:unknown [Prevotella sp. CAG:1058]|nr:unknown [Prevotella sp. CAG:1058]
MSLFTLNNSVIPCPTKSQNGGCTRNWFQSITAKAGNNL